jgi:hypothetical protein
MIAGKKPPSWECRRLITTAVQWVVACGSKLGWPRQACGAQYWRRTRPAPTSAVGHDLWRHTRGLNSTICSAARPPGVPQPPEFHNRRSPRSRSAHI